MLSHTVFKHKHYTLTVVSGRVCVVYLSGDGAAVHMLLPIKGALCMCERKRETSFFLHL